MSNSFHGRTMGAMSVTSNEASHLAFGPILEGLVRVKFNDINEIKDVLTAHKDIAAILLEPIQGEGGIISCSDDYMKELSDMCIANKILLMADEVQSGFCRTGKWFSYQHFNVSPDVVLNVTKERIIRLLPPLICEEQHILNIVDIIEQLIKENYE